MKHYFLSLYIITLEKSVKKKIKKQRTYKKNKDKKLE
jgi:hypothetical protein